jgi:hypothetical protein
VKHRPILENREAVALQRIGGNFRGIAKQAAQPSLIEVAKALKCVANEQGTKRASEKWRKAPAMR